MTIHQPIDCAQASRSVRAVFDDINTARGVADVNNVWKYLANDPKTLKRTWESLKDVMGPGDLSPVVKEMIYLAISITTAARTASRATARWRGLRA